LTFAQARMSTDPGAGVEPQRGEREEGERREERGRGRNKQTKIYFQTESSGRNVLSVYRDGREPMQY